MTDFRSDLRAGELLAAWVSLDDPAVAELTAPDVEVVFLDTEHTPHSYRTVTDQVRAVDAAEGECATVARVPWNDPVELKRVLDIGVDGVMVPMVETAAEARAAVDATRYPPAGSRGVAAARATGYGRYFEEYVGRADDEIGVIVQIESAAGVENAAEIAAVEGVDALFVGPADLSKNLDAFLAFDDEQFVEAVDRVTGAAADAGIASVTLAADPAVVEPMLDLGFDFVVAGVDTGHLRRGTREAIEAVENAQDG